ncbi:MAG: ParA family protein [Clostridia bacterium]|nr:ParA family protein [Clostridia bacterium]
MGKIIAFANQKGGIGKTTSAINVAACIAECGKKVLVVDCDPQGNCTSGFGINKKSLRFTSYDLLVGRVGAQDAMIRTEFEGISVIPANISLAGAEFELVELDNRAYRLKNELDKVKDEFDYIVIDCPPSLGILTINALGASDGVVIPMQCEYFALEGLSQLMMTIRKTKELYNANLEISGILITMYNGRLNLSTQVLKELKKYYADKILSEPIPRSVRISEAPSHGLPINYYDKNGKSAKAYLAVAKELMTRI